MPVDTDQTEETEELRGQMSFLDHLEELRQRIIRALIAVGLAFIATWTLADDLFAIVSSAILAAGGSLNMTQLAEPFNVEFKLAIVAAIFLTSPFLMAQVWGFISPGLYKHERRYAGPFIIFGTVLFYLGGMFGHLVAFPYAVQFLLDWGRTMKLTTLLSVSSYFDMYLWIMLGLGIVFEIPAVIFILSRIGLVTAGFLVRHFKYAVLICFVVSAVITPTTDVPTMMLMAGPMIALYGLGIIVAFFFGKKRTAD